MAATNPGLARLRKIVGRWPEVTEKISHGAPTFWGGRKTFVAYRNNHHGDGRRALWIKSTLEAQESLVALDPETFFVPPYVGPSGWVGMRIDRKPDWGRAEELLEEAYRSVAPARALAALDASPASGA
ncbi:MAG: MmcQ/YjbR family DNA-binding protein [Myxococcota bacterium]